jgi:hypothetical protein
VAEAEDGGAGSEMGGVTQGADSFQGLPRVGLAGQTSVREIGADLFPYLCHSLSVICKSALQKLSEVLLFRADFDYSGRAFVASFIWSTVNSSPTLNLT